MIPDIPSIETDQIALQMVMQHVCAWEAWIQGPVPLGQQKHIVVHINCMILPSREEAEECVAKHIMSICEDSDYPFDPDEWTILQMKLNNAN